jgi:hypothetical protein
MPIQSPPPKSIRRTCAAIRAATRSVLHLQRAPDSSISNSLLSRPEVVAAIDTLSLLEPEFRLAVKLSSVVRTPQTLSIDQLQSLIDVIAENTMGGSSDLISLKLDVCCGRWIREGRLIRLISEMKAKCMTKSEITIRLESRLSGTEVVRTLAEETPAYCAAHNRHLDATFGSGKLVRNKPTLTSQ